MNKKIVNDGKETRKSVMWTVVAMCIRFTTQDTIGMAIYFSRLGHHRVVVCDY